MSITFKVTALSLAIASVMSSSVVSQANAQEVTNDESGLEVIMVTSRKAVESIQDVPLAISAFSAEDIAKRSIEELEDVAMSTPGLSFEDYSNGGYGTPIIRGASQFSVDQLEQNVSTFVDGVYIPRNYALDLGAMDMERIEVVKGPQGALYGANSFMGAINYITSKADLGGLTGEVGLVVGDGGRRDITGNISVPIIEDKLAVKFNFTNSDYDGDWTNSHPAAQAGVSPGTDDSLGGWDKKTYSISLVAKPTETVDIEMAYHSFDSFTEGKAQSRLEIGDYNCGGSLFGGPVRGYCGELPDTPLEFGTDTETGFLIDPRTYALDSETEIFRASISAELTNNFSVSYQFANIQGETMSAGISDRSPLTGTDLTPFGIPAFLNAFTVLPVGGFDYDSHELRAEYTADNGVYAMFGVYSSDGEDRDTGQTGYYAPLYTDNLDPITEDSLDPDSRNNNITITEATALFGRVAVPLMDDKLVLAVEGRYTDETKKQNITYIDESTADDYEDSYFTPRFTADYSINKNQLVYFSAAQGVKSGGLNPEISGGLEDSEKVYQADENTTYEIGSKNTILDGDLRINAAVYYIDWTELQVSQAAINGGFFTTSIVGNLGSATSKGLELDVTYALTDAITVNAGLALNNAKYDDGTISQRLARAAICDDIVCAANGDIGGNSLPRSSDTQWNIGAQYDGEFNDNLEYFVRADLTGQSEQYMSEANIATLPSRTLLNLRGGVTGENWSAELWVKNATDEEYVSNAFYIPSAYFVSIVPTWGNQRRIGVSAEYRF
ncbi:TonB-dependent receptor [Aliiglaciecola sp. 2_MG-2023]|uniref:TonB-dependent receptor n=1 Tax=unclassified Aliiglaciecola TaxID=2593648 RepID=UPI0026E14594|nr:MULTISPECIES: TonB-dependent receptor [unclassified Aliiglaciecola]MDO6710324.1 TonB-dependent receptor [Aliiglaciecola sp. 2_MG-2023]MDO6751472.1 TonB-dependent receptor [Aliiglaciecola sp. 1_MG-2023]